MKKNLQFLASLGAFLLFLGTGSVYGATITHTFSATSGDIDANISFTTEKNSASSDPAFNVSLRLYAYRQSGDGNSLTLVPKNGAKITQVVITANTTAYTPPTSYYIDGANAGTSISWSGVTGTISAISASSSLKIQNRQYAPGTGGATTRLDIKSIEITYTEPQCTSAELSFGVSGGIIYKTTDAADFTQAASSKNTDAIAYTSSNLSVATVNSSTGEVTIAGVGTTTITASQVANAIYCAGSDEYTLIVGEDFQLVTKDSHLIAGGEYIVVSGTYALGKQNPNNRAAFLIDAPSGSSILVPIASASTDEYACKLTLGGSAGAWTLTDVVNGYKIGPSTSAGNDNHLKQNDNATWTISIAAETSEASIVCTAGGHAERNTLRYNSTSGLFACYSAGQNDVYLYATPETLAATNLATAIANDEVVATKYYNLQGVEVTPQSGNIYIAKRIHASGKVSVVKEFKK